MAENHRKKKITTQMLLLVIFLYFHLENGLRSVRIDMKQYCNLNPTSQINITYIFWKHLYCHFTTKCVSDICLSSMTSRVKEFMRLRSARPAQFSTSLRTWKSGPQTARTITVKQQFFWKYFWHFYIKNINISKDNLKLLR